MKMSSLILVNEAEKYGGQYVATKSFLDKDVVVSGSDMAKVHKDAIAAGIADPVVFYVPKDDIVQIY